METLARRLDLLKLEGLGFSQVEIVKELSEKYEVSERTVQYDFSRRSEWQPELSEVKDVNKVLMRIVNRYEQIYRNASRIYLTGSNEIAQLGALNVMLKANQQLAEAVVIPDLIHDLEQIKEKVGARLKHGGL